MKMKIIGKDTHCLDQMPVVKAAWTSSRHLDDTPVEQLYGIDAPVADFASVTLDVQCTIIEREIICTFRDHIVWARTSRVDDPADFEIDEHFNYDCYAQYKLKMQFERSKGVSQDTYRMSLPVVALTRLTMKISARSLVKLMRAFHYIGTNDQLFYDAAVECQRVYREAFGHEPPESIKYVELFPVIEEASSTGVAGDQVVVSAHVPIALRAQMIRHRALYTKTNKTDLLYDYEDNTIGTPVMIQASGDRSVWEDLIAKRACWMAQADLWAPLLNRVSRMLGIETRALPCKNGSCPYDKDAQLRYTSADPGAPCPMHSVLTSTKIEDFNPIHDQMVREQRPHFWMNIIQRSQEISK